VKIDCYPFIRKYLVIGKVPETFLVPFKGFHDAVLEHGAVTLPILGDLVDEWVAATAA
jgi:hypothetical protein